MKEMLLSWRVEEPGPTKKTGAWYGAIAILGGGAALASFIGGNMLFGILVILGAFAVMLAGSRPGSVRTCAISERGIHIGPDLIAFDSLDHFAISDDEPRRLLITVRGLVGTTYLPLSGVDFRAVRSELKNRNIEEIEYHESFVERLTNALGI